MYKTTQWQSQDLIVHLLSSRPENLPSKTPPPDPTLPQMGNDREHCNHFFFNQNTGIWAAQLNDRYPVTKVDLDFYHCSFAYIVFISPNEPETSQWQRPRSLSSPSTFVLRPCPGLSTNISKRKEADKADECRQTWLQLQLCTYYHLCDLEQRR